MSENIITVVRVNVGEFPTEVKIENGLRASQEIVEGNIEAFTLTIDNTTFVGICNEEGKMHNLQPNTDIGHDVIVGNFFVTKDGDNGEFVSLSEDEVAMIKEYIGKRRVF